MTEIESDSQAISTIKRQDECEDLILSVQILLKQDGH